jgi:microcystin-dependent protein
MSSTYSPSLKLELIGNGDQSGTWGTTTNNNLGTLLEQAITGVQNITMSNADYTLSNYNGTSDEARNAVLVIGGTNSAIRKIVAPQGQNKTYIISNQTSGGYSITIGAPTGTAVTIPSGVVAQVYTDGANFYSSQTGSAGNFTVNGTLTAAGLTDTGNLSVSGTLTGVSASFSGTLTAPTAASGTNTTQVATTAFVAQNAVLTGALLMWPTTSAPTGYLNCDGTAVSRTTYSALFAVIGTTFGTGDGTTTFNLPNYTNRMPYGTTIGSTGGAATTTISQANLPNVNFPVTDPGHAHLYDRATTKSVQSGNSTPCFVDNSTVSTQTATTGISVNSGGSGTPASTISPYLGINFIIKT